MYLQLQISYLTACTLLASYFYVTLLFLPLYSFIPHVQLRT